MDCIDRRRGERRTEREGCAITPELKVNTAHNHFYGDCDKKTIDALRVILANAPLNEEKFKLNKIQRVNKESSHVGEILKSKIWGPLCVSLQSRVIEAVKQVRPGCQWPETFEHDQRWEKRDDRQIKPHIRTMLYETNDFHSLHNDHIGSDHFVSIVSLADTTDAAGYWEIACEVSTSNGTTSVFTLPATSLTTDGKFLGLTFKSNAHFGHGWIRGSFEGPGRRVAIQMSFCLPDIFSHDDFVKLFQFIWNT